ncbi:Rho GTPase-activating protein REN1-like protein isoform X1 [Tanacetum coccineum]
MRVEKEREREREREREGGGESERERRGEERVRAEDEGGKERERERREDERSLERSRVGMRERRQLDERSSAERMETDRAESKNNKVDWKHNHSDVKSYSDSKNNTDVVSQGDVGGDHISHSSGVAQPPERHYSRQFSHNGNKVYKSGPLFLSSKGIGWTSWKKRWFILTETSLVFFRSDPSAAPQKGGEANLTLGGIDLNSSGSVVMKADKKLITVLFPDGHDGRAFTLKAETSEDLFEWKDALVLALSNAPSAVTVQGQNGISKNDKDDLCDGSHEQSKDQSPRKSTVLGRPILLALEDVDGTPSFLEKALCYVEDYGVNVEGILRQAADVDDVERRIREYEQGKTEFGEDEDGHVIGDCIKFVLRELPSPPVPASCCAALLEAYKTDRATRASAIRSAICDTFPEPNRRLLQR